MTITDEMRKEWRDAIAERDAARAELAALRSTLVLVIKERDHFETAKDILEAEAEEFRFALAALRPVVVAAACYAKRYEQRSLVGGEPLSALLAAVRAWREGKDGG
jgi:hypothetical protein